MSDWSISFDDADEPIALEFAFTRDGKKFTLRFELEVSDDVHD